MHHLIATLDVSMFLQLGERLILLLVFVIMGKNGEELLHNHSAFPHMRDATWKVGCSDWGNPE